MITGGLHSGKATVPTMEIQETLAKLYMTTPDTIFIFRFRNNFGDEKSHFNDDLWFLGLGEIKDIAT